ncbi:MAG: hypothetical protein ACKOHG_14985 [Planctomycetia bacterium]
MMTLPARAGLRRLRADVLRDAVVAVTGVPGGLSGWPTGTEAIEPWEGGGLSEKRSILAGCCKGRGSLPVDMPG